MADRPTLRRELSAAFVLVFTGAFLVASTGVLMLMPPLGEGVVEGTVTRWLKRVGDTVAAGEPLLEVSTDKVDTEIPADADGVLGEIRVAAGQAARVGAALAMIAPR